MKNLILSLGILAIINVSSKAEVSYGAKIGGELTHLWDTDFNLSGPKLGFTGGPFLKIKFLGIFGIQPEVIYIAKGGEYSESASGTIFSFSDPSGQTSIPLTVTRITEFQNIDVPLLFKLYAPGFITASPHLLAGPFYGYMVKKRKVSVSISGVNGTTPVTKGDFVDPNEFDTIGEERAEKGEDNQHEFGLVIGGGVDFSLGTLDVRYSIGLTGIEKTAGPNRDLEKSQTGTITVLVGFEL